MIKKITIWDNDPSRIAQIEQSLMLVMKDLGIKYEISSMSEPPLLSRMGLYGKTPALEINGNYWTWKIGEVIPEQKVKNLLVFIEKTFRDGDK